ncbi:hypothetical protein PUNSTDRAFT_124275 [Punctularia strigosozonata HHB-11173 SS5]|uniref:uncharacterized protein n=1 Tax=Punctularia strigosozonata (strain HHB-11173) TaxID=741275 RepID=UPI00044182FE|nr:uncharacterized protein PUNSTDRAFT_124275 [Punctularia strigosozonata HHB-11173 SS5]EIN12409.1 hypothetical protein PUNSTDRAFT_124275 [Punctularia strigosozonata HHB-11173 SS5]
MPTHTIPPSSPNAETPRSPRLSFFSAAPRLRSLSNAAADPPRRTPSKLRSPRVQQRPSTSSGAIESRSVWDASAASLKNAAKPLSDLLRRRSTLGGRPPSHDGPPRAHANVLRRSASSSKSGHQHHPSASQRPSRLGAAAAAAPSDDKSSSPPAAAPHKPREVRIQLDIPSLSREDHPAAVPDSHRVHHHHHQQQQQRHQRHRDPPTEKQPIEPNLHAKIATDDDKEGDDDDDEPRFPTADRVILAELQASLRARETQFALKNGRRYHGFSPRDVPYPRSYDRLDLDQDVWETKFCQQACGSVTWHVFETPPSKVLDLGCGTGTWILDCAKVWKKTHFVGLDVVPLHADLQRTGYVGLASRVTWVQANFLEPLPFPDDEFDFVHIKRIARGVPEDKWNALFEELVRVMKPGAAFEMIEEDLYFPGAQDPSPPDTPVENRSRSASPSPPPLPLPRPAAPAPSSTASASEEGARSSSSSSSWSLVGTPAGSLPASRYETPAASTRGPSPSMSQFTAWGPPRTRSATQHDEDRAASSSSSSSHARPEASTPPPDPRDHALLATIYAEMHAARFVNLRPLALLANHISEYFKDVRTHPPIMLRFPPRPTDARSSSPVSESDSDSDDGGSPRPRRSSTRDRHPARPPPPSSSAPRSPHLPARAPARINAQDLIRRAAATFISLDETRSSAFSPSAHASFPASRRFPAPPNDEDEDDNEDGRAHLAETRRMNRLPNKRLEIDLRSLNLHLHLRSTEVLACAEGMWDWVVAYQRRQRAKTSVATGVPGGGGTAVPSPHPPRPPHPPPPPPQRAQRNPNIDPQHARIGRLTRGEFDALLRWFEFDMQDATGLRTAIEDRLGWRTWDGPRSQERRAFDKACKRWEEFQRRQRPAATSPPPPSPPPPLPPTGRAARAGEVHLASPSFTPSEVARGRDDDRRSGQDQGLADLAGEKEKEKEEKEKEKEGRPRPTLQAPMGERDDPASRRLSRTVRVFVAWKA